MKRYPDHDARDHQQDLQLFKLAAHDTKDWHEEVKEESYETGFIDFEFQFYQHKEFQGQEDSKNDYVRV